MRGVEPAQAHMGVGGSATVWVDGPSFKENLLRLPNLAAVLILTRDEGSGRVYLGPCGAPFLNYWVSPPDRKSMLEVCHRHVFPSPFPPNSRMCLEKSNSAGRP